MGTHYVLSDELTIQLQDERYQAGIAESQRLIQEMQYRLKNLQKQNQEAVETEALSWYC